MVPAEGVFFHVEGHCAKRKEDTLKESEHKHDPVSSDELIHIKCIFISNCRLSVKVRR